MADFLHVVLLPQAGDLLDWGGSGGQKIDTGGSVSLRRTILLKDFNDSVPQNASSHPCSPQGPGDPLSHPGGWRHSEAHYLKSLLVGFSV